MSGPAIDASPALTFNQSSASIQQRRLSTGRQMWVLYRRFAAPSLLNGEVLTTVGAPIIFMVGFYIPFAIPWNQFVGGASSGVASNLGNTSRRWSHCRRSRSPRSGRAFEPRPIRC